MSQTQGSDIGSISEATGLLTRFFNLRLDSWTDHFFLDGVKIRPLTAIGQVTERIHKFNDSERIFEREALHLVRRYPCTAASPPT
jgi:hypothetical protein